VNRTSGKPQAGVPVTLVKPGANGMQTLGSTSTDANGHFAFDKDQPGGGPQLLQAAYKGVTYNKLMTPNIPTSNVELPIYEATASPAVARIVERMLIIQPSTGQISVGENVMIQNPSNTTYNDPVQGGLRFYLPPAANGQVRVNAQGPQGMPLPRAAERTNETDVYKVNFPIKPGETQFEVSYVLPAGTPFTFRGRNVGVKGMPAGPLRIVVPSGVTLAGKDVQNVGTEPKTLATIYNVTAPDAFTADITGIGSLRASDDSAASGDNSDSPPLTEGPPQIYRHQAWLILLGLSILGVGLVVLFRNSPVRD
jgi:hypothetical protein